MERTILFRGIIKYPDDIFKGFWYGNLIIYANGDTFIRQIETGQEFEVIPETVGEFTGLTDKNGVKVFEGDVVKVCNSYGYGFLASGTVATIKWSDTEVCYFIDGKYRLTKNKKIEVIGNIHDKHVL